MLVQGPVAIGEKERRMVAHEPAQGERQGGSDR